MVTRITELRLVVPNIREGYFLAAWIMSHVLPELFHSIIVLVAEVRNWWNGGLSVPENIFKWDVLILLLLLCVSGPVCPGVVFKAAPKDLSKS